MKTGHGVLFLLLLINLLNWIEIQVIAIIIEIKRKINATNYDNDNHLKKETKIGIKQFYFF